MSSAINPLCECDHIKTLHLEGTGPCYATVFTRGGTGDNARPCSCSGFRATGEDAGPRDALGDRVQLLHGLRTRLDELQVDVKALVGEHSIFLTRLHAAERIPAILRRARSWLVNPDGATIQLAAEDAAALDTALAEFGHVPAAEGVSTEIVVRLSRPELGELVDAIAFTVSPKHRENAPLLERLQALYIATRQPTVAP